MEPSGGLAGAATDLARLLAHRDEFDSILPSGRPGCRPSSSPGRFLIPRRQDFLAATASTITPHQEASIKDLSQTSQSGLWFADNGSPRDLLERPAHRPSPVTLDSSDWYPAFTTVLNARLNTS